MARSKFFSLWGQKNASEEEEEDKKPAEGSAAEDEQDDTSAEGDDPEDDEETSAEFDDEEDEEEDDEATQAEVAKVSRRAATAIRRAERQRVHAIVKAAGPDRVEAGLQLALGTTLSVKDARVALAATTDRSPAGGRLGLAGEMSSRRRPQLGAAAAPGAAGDTDKAAAFILKSGKV